MGNTLQFSSGCSSRPTFWGANKEDSAVLPLSLKQTSLSLLYHLLQRTNIKSGPGPNLLMNKNSQEVKIF